MDHSSHYAALGVAPGADFEAIRNSFRQKAKLFHPDAPGGDARFFIRMSEAYKVLSDPVRREAYDRSRRRSTPRFRGWWPGAGRGKAAGRDSHFPPDHDRWTEATRDTWPDPSPSGKENRPSQATVTRVMSMAVPRLGRFKVEGVVGDIRIATTAKEKLWATTRQKFEAMESTRLARHVIQIRVSGLGHHVRRMRVHPTDFGAELRCLALEGTGEEKGAAGPAPFRTKPQLSLEITVPEEMMICLNEVSGAIVLEDMKGKLKAKVLGGILRAGRVGDINLHLQGNSCAFIAEVKGNVDLLSSDGSRIFLGGAVHRLRAVLEHQSSAKLDAKVDILEAQVLDQARLDANQEVGEAQCDVQGNGQIRLARVTSHHSLHRSQEAGIEVQNHQAEIPAARQDLRPTFEKGETSPGKQDDAVSGLSAGGGGRKGTGARPAHGFSWLELNKF